MKKTLSILFLGMVLGLSLHLTGECSETSDEGYKEIAYTIIERIKGMNGIFEHFNGIEENAKVSDDEDTLWITFDYENGMESVLDEETSAEVKTFSEDQGIDISLYFYKGDWKGSGEARPFPLGDLNVLVFVEGADTEELQTIRSAIGQIILDEKNNYELSLK